MAKITKLQEDKAAMQMKVLQYQRMMEEQAEYDQEALQLFNDLMIKREKEKQELENQVYRKKVLDYESREKIMWRSRNTSSTSTPSSASSSHSRHNNEHSIHLNWEEYDDSSFDLHQESCYKNSDDALNDLQENGLYCNIYLNVPDISLAEFEEERLCILEDPKALEAQLFSFE
ncbi:Myosin-binding protein 3 [Forsythia ovata]|uniref:Myosin-binding protein 3 n=1 Tax=Forsythia ovata TaxID=205694 RepID=A0ABD1UBD1_9LAMI